jgi:hypothetical protein
MTDRILTAKRKGSVAEGRSVHAYRREIMLARQVERQLAIRHQCQLTTIGPMD